MSGKSIGIIGLGYVGTAVLNGMEQCYDIETFDKYKLSSCENLEELCSKVHAIFVCVPTPMKKTGECDISIVEDVLLKLNQYCTNHLVILKSTVPPTTTSTLDKKYDNISLIFNPEFLTEANYINDFICCNRVILGGEKDSIEAAEKIYSKRFPGKAIVKTTATTAEMVKYIANTFLATKVSFANEIKQVCDEIEVDFASLTSYAKLDSRLGHSHWSVPGHDGHYGFGGSCFPKDVNALLYFMKSIKVESTVLQAVWDKNLEVRPEKDWEDLVGRAVTKEKQELKNE